MDYPIFHLDGMGNRLLVGIVAVLHVLINHALAVGAMPLIAALEWRGLRTKDKRWDDFAYKFLFICFIITTTVGAMTGVGIWLTTSLVNPAAIGSLLRVFFWAWFTEWLVFITEVVLILCYFLLWKKWRTGRQKEAHLKLGIALGVFSWITMALIVAILGFMMSTGDWTNKPSLLSGVFNPLYLPQLAFRTPLALMSAGLAGLFISTLVLKSDDDFRLKLRRFMAGWTLLFAPLTALGGWWYWSVVPKSMLGNLPVAVSTMAFTKWHEQLMQTAAGALVVILVVALWALLIPRFRPPWAVLAALLIATLFTLFGTVGLLGLRLGKGVAVFCIVCPLLYLFWKPRASSVWVERFAFAVPLLLTFALLGYFERVREFIRKPWVIANYMYANGLRGEDYPLLQREGVLKHAVYVHAHEVIPGQELVGGRDVFLLACSRCHTSDGMNGLVSKFTTLLGKEKWSEDAIVTYTRSMHGARTFMPQFPGNESELNALAKYIASLQTKIEPVEGAQTMGITLPKQQVVTLVHKGPPPENHQPMTVAAPGASDFE